MSTHVRSAGGFISGMHPRATQVASCGDLDMTITLEDHGVTSTTSELKDIVDDSAQALRRKAKELAVSQPHLAADLHEMAVDMERRARMVMNREPELDRDL